jgi:hypothetical protein
MKSSIMIIVLQLALTGSGCSSLRPPAENRADWEQQQKKEAEVANNALWGEHQGMFWSLYLSLIGAAIANNASLPIIDNSKSNQSPSP